MVLGFLFVFAGNYYALWVAEKDGAVFDAALLAYPLVATFWAAVSISFVWAARESLKRKLIWTEKLAIGVMSALFVFGGHSLASGLSSVPDERHVNIYGAIAMMSGSILIARGMLGIQGPARIRSMARQLSSYPGLCLKNPPRTLIDLAPGLLALVIMSVVLIFAA